MTFTPGTHFFIEYYNNMLNSEVKRETEKAVLLECEPYKGNDPFTLWVAKKYILNRISEFVDQSGKTRYSFKYDISSL